LRAAHGIYALFVWPPANSTFPSDQTSHQQSDSSIFLSEQISTSHQPSFLAPAKIRRMSNILSVSHTIPIFR
jgi:hypothetical protein